VVSTAFDNNLRKTSDWRLIIIIAKSIIAPAIVKKIYERLNLGLLAVLEGMMIVLSDFNGLSLASLITSSTSSS
jgi:hypothetical protein